MRRSRKCCFHENGQMPIYEYRCDNCAHEFETIQKVSEDPLKTCPACAQDALRKKISAAGFRLKGGGWYETDFKSGGKRNVAGEEKSGEKAGKDSQDGAKGSKEGNGGDKSKGGASSGEGGGKTSGASSDGASSSSSKRDSGASGSKSGGTPS